MIYLFIFSFFWDRISCSKAGFELPIFLPLSSESHPTTHGSGFRLLSITAAQRVNPGGARAAHTWAAPSSFSMEGPYVSVFVFASVSVDLNIYPFISRWHLAVPPEQRICLILKGTSGHYLCIKTKNCWNCGNSGLFVYVFI